MLVGGKSMDLIKLFVNVKKNGGYERVTENGLWDFVAKECAFFDVSDGLALKLVYVENLEKIFESLKRVAEEKIVVEHSVSDTYGGCSMDLSSNLEPLLSEVSDIKKKNEVNYVKVDWDECDSDDVCVEKLPEMVHSHDHVDSVEDIEDYHIKPVSNDVIDLVSDVDDECDASSGGCSMDLSSDLEPFLSEVSDLKKKNDATYAKVDWDDCDSEKLPEIDDSYDIQNHHTRRVLPNNVKEECLTSFEFKPIKTAAFRKESVPVIDKGSDSKRKRKRESAIGILDWIHRVARDPCDPAIGSLPESSEWKDYATDVVWKQALLIHDAMLLKRTGYSDGQHFSMQKRQKMHPTMYDEPENFRHSQRIHSAKGPPEKPHSRTVSKSSSLKRDNDENLEFPDYLSNKHHQIRVNIGQKHQADVQKWTEKKKSSYEVDSKWFGTPIWPQHNKNLIEREPLGKGRSDSCGCQFPGSTECVQFHISEKSKRLKLELGIAFYLWRFNGMGEGTSVTWTKEEENKFLETWKLNPVKSLGGFLDESVKALPNKSRALLVNYYFNVYLLRRRGKQNRISPNNITSDDEDDDEETVLERVKPTTVGSMKKTRLKKTR